MDELVHELPALLDRQDGLVAGLTPGACVAAGTLDRAHRDPVARLLAATSIESGIPPVSADSVFGQLAGRRGWPARVR